MLRLLLLVVLVVAALLLVHWLMHEDPKKVARALRRGALWGAVLAMILLAAAGRLNWLYAAIASAVPLAMRLLSLLRYVPIFSQLYTHAQNAQASRRGPLPNTSQVESRFLRMTLEQDSGHMDGVILEGPSQGRRLSELDLRQLLELLRLYRVQDDESAALLEAYLDRVHGEAWHDAGGGAHGGRTEAAPSGAMSRAEACEVLGVDTDASREEIIAAHRRLMQKLHPDRGGSTYLAAKINQAKDVMLANRG